MNNGGIMLNIKEVDWETFTKSQENFPQQNFLQTGQMARLQALRGRDVSCLLVFEDETIVGQLLVQYRKIKRFFKEALILHGPIYSNQDQALISQLIASLESYFKKQKVAKISYFPYVIETIKDNQLQTVQSQLNGELIKSFSTAGYQRAFDKEQEMIINTQFVKPLETIHTKEELLENLIPSVKRDIKKSQAMQVKIEELNVENLDEFYHILQMTGERKGFSIQEFDYFKSIKEQFKEHAKFMLAYLDCEAYQNYLNQNISSFETKIKELEDRPQKKRTKGQIADAKDQLRSYYKRQEEFDHMSIQGNKLPLSSYLFMCYGNEIVSFQGGNDERYMNFCAATLIHWEMLQYAINNQYQLFNFYGTTETEMANAGKGNFKFKSQFGGQLDILVGEFYKILNPVLKIIN